MMRTSGRKGFVWGGQVEPEDRKVKRQVGLFVGLLRSHC